MQDDRWSSERPGGGRNHEPRRFALIMPEMSRGGAQVQVFDYGRLTSDQLGQHLVVLAEDEAFLAHWNVLDVTARLGTARAHLLVTDQRLIVMSSAGSRVNRTRRIQEMSIGDVSGLTVHIDAGLGPLGAFAAALFALATLALAVMGEYVISLGTAFLFFLILVLGLPRREAAIAIAANNSQTGPIRFGILPEYVPVAGFSRLLAPLYVFLARRGLVRGADLTRFQPSEQLEILMGQLGALVRDVNRLGAEQTTRGWLRQVPPHVTEP